MVDYPQLPTVESGSESERGSASRQKGRFLNVQSKPSYVPERQSTEESDGQRSEGSDKEVNELSTLLGGFGKRRSNEEGRDSDKKSRKKSDKVSGKKYDKDSESDEDSESDNAADLRRVDHLIEELERSKGPGKKSGKKSDLKGNQPSEDDESSVEHKKATQYTKEQREEATRVRKCPEKDYYAILDLDEDCSQSDVKKAYMKLSLLTHPDKNKYKDAVKAFRLISRAYQVLGNSTERKKYDRNRKVYKLRGEFDPLDLWDEEFAENASGTDSGSESDGDDSEEEEEIKPDAFRLEIYKKATPWVRKLLANPRDSSSKSKIESLNNQIKKQNKKDGLQEGELLISTNVLRSIGIEAGVVVKALEKDPDDKRAKEVQGKLEKQLEKTVRTNSYPKEWLDFLPWSRGDKGKGRAGPASSKREEKGKGRAGPASSKREEKGKGRAGPASSKREEKGKGRERPSSSNQTEGDSDTEMPDAGSFSSNEKKKKKTGSSKRDNEGSDTEMPDAVTRRRKWKPGQETRKGERILGWRPFYKTDRKKDEQLFNGCQLVIEKKGQPNPIALVSGEEVGRRVVDAYRDLSEEEQNDIRYSEERYTYEDVNRFDTLLGFACKPFNTKTEGSGAYYPVGYALYSFTDGSQDLVSRECMRQVFGKTDADNEIADFYEDIGETPPWLITKKLLSSGSEVKHQRKSRRRADSDDESDSDSDSSSIFVSAKKKGRRYGRDAESSDDDNSSGDDSGGGRKRSRIPRRKRDSKTKKTKAIDSNNQSDAFAGIMQRFMKQIAEENRRQAKDMSKKFEEVLSRIPVSAAS